MATKKKKADWPSEPTWRKAFDVTQEFLLERLEKALAELIDECKPRCGFCVNADRYIVISINNSAKALLAHIENLRRHNKLCVAAQKST